jgi:hypothetical protein
MNVNFTFAQLQLDVLHRHRLASSRDAAEQMASLF